MISGTFANVSELATGFGQRGVPAEKVAANSLDCWQQDERSAAPVGEHLADQLLLPLWLAGGGSFLCTARLDSEHLATNADLINRFGGARIDLAATGKQHLRVSVC